MPEACGIVLAGGLGTRLGLDVPKARAPLAGRTLLEHAVSTLAATCDEVVVVCPSGFDPGPMGVARRVDDVAGVAGPLAGLVAGLEATQAPRAIVLGVDLPCVTTAFVRALLERLDQGGAIDAIVPRPDGTPQPLASAFHASAAPLVRAALESGKTSLRGALGNLAVGWLEGDALEAMPGGSGALLNVNTPADLEAARVRLESSAGPAR